MSQSSTSSSSQSSSSSSYVVNWSSSSSASSNSSSSIDSSSSSSSLSTGGEGNQYCMSGFATSNLNGTYTDSTFDHNGKPYYSNGFFYLAWYVAEGGLPNHNWVLTTTLDDDWDNIAAYGMSNNVINGSYSGDNAYVGESGMLVAGSC